MKDEQKNNKEAHEETAGKVQLDNGKNGRLMPKPLPVSAIWHPLFKTVLPVKW